MKSARLVTFHPYLTVLLSAALCLVCAGTAVATASEWRRDSSQSLDRQELAPGFLHDTPLTEAARDPLFVWSPTNNTLVYRVRNSSPTGPGGTPYDLWLLEADSGAKQLIASGGHVWRPAFSSDGRYIQYWKDGLPYRYNIREAASHLVLTSEFPVKGEFSPDGQQLIYVTLHGNVRITNTQTRVERLLGQSTPLAQTGAIWPEWSPDGAYVAFLANGQASLLPAAAESLTDLVFLGPVSEPQGEASADHHYLRWSVDGMALQSYKGDIFVLRPGVINSSIGLASVDQRFVASQEDEQLFLQDRVTGIRIQITHNRGRFEDRQSGDRASLAPTVVANGFDFPVGKPNGDGYNTTAGCWFLQRDGECAPGPHPGQDFNKNCGGDCDLGEPVYAVANGIVVDSENYPPVWGNIILIEHTLPDGNKVWSQYAHLQNRLVGKDTTVEKGAQIGTIGKGYNNIYYAHLHFEIRTQYLGRPGYLEHPFGYLGCKESWRASDWTLNAGRDRLRTCGRA